MTKHIACELLSTVFWCDLLELLINVCPNENAKIAVRKFQMNSINEGGHLVEIFRPRMVYVKICCLSHSLQPRRLLPRISRTIQHTFLNKYPATYKNPQIQTVWRFRKCTQAWIQGIESAISTGYNITIHLTLTLNYILYKGTAKGASSEEEVIRTFTFS